MCKGKTYGYVRCSSAHQNETRQLIAMQEFGVSTDCIVVEKMSGKDFDRPLYKKLVKQLKPGDTLILSSTDRLGRNYQEIIDQWRYITKEIGASIVVLDMPVLDTRNNDLSLTGAFISDLVLAILSYVAETERSFNRKRQAEGIAAAQAKGVKFGRRPKERPPLLEALSKLWENGTITSREAGQQLGISHTTFLKWVRE